MARKSVTFELTAEQEATLKMWVGSHRTQQRYSRRAQVILLSAEGLTLGEISARSGLNRTNCLKWRKRFAAEGVDGLKDKSEKVVRRALPLGSVPKWCGWHVRSRLPEPTPGVDESLVV